MEIWTEKYRPKNFEDITGQESIVKRIRAMAERKDLPHLLFTGPPGSGKTSLSLVIAKQLYGVSWRENFLELNASNDRGIDIIRNTVKDFAKTKSIGEVPFKIIYLDEADALTKEAQQALRRTMENYASVTRFILSCVTPETKILLPEEVEITISDFIKNFEDKKLNKIENINKSIEAKKDQILACVILNPKIIEKKVFEITTITGRKLKVTGDHRLLTTKGMVPAEKLNKEDKLLVYPHLENTYFEDRKEKIINLDKFIEFLSKKEEELGYKSIENANRFKDLKTLEKEIIKRIKGLCEEIKDNNGLTEREYDIYEIINKNKDIISRKEIQDKINLSRMRVVQLLREVENKGFIERIINKKVHLFKINNTKPKILRNFMHIKNIIEKEFKIKVSYCSIKKCLNDDINRGQIDRILGELKRKDLLDISYNDEKIGALSRIVAFMMGDGHIVKKGGVLVFSGNKKALENVKKDLKILCYDGTKIYTKKVESSMGERKIIGKTTWFNLNSVSLSLFLQYLGVPAGDKASSSYNVPYFIKSGTKFVKREFLRSFFGCEGDNPKNFKKCSFGAITLPQNKIKELERNGLDYLKEIKDILKEFEIESYINSIDLNKKRKKDDKLTVQLKLTLKSSNTNLFKFLSRIGYYYEEYKMKESRNISEYLRYKHFSIELQKQKAIKAIELVRNGKKNAEIAREIGCTLDFVSDRIEGKNVKLAYRGFPSFKEWSKKNIYKNGFVWNTIYEIKEIDSNEVMDITCCSDHNFITNGFISHNCNYSSKIIDPIQSRCTIFRFKGVEKESVFECIDKIAKEENLKISKDAKEILYENSNGDLRRMLNILQSCASASDKIDSELIYETVSGAQPKELRKIIEYAIKGEFLKSKTMLLDTMLKNGLSGLDIIKQIQKEVFELDIDEKSKLRLIEKCGEIEFRMVEGSDEFIQLQALLAGFYLG